ncbi:DUF6328 family protein [Streptomyces sp. NPDC047009]|uniref:DUF6328 family protein n=1 Tax=unclassified Streptomyces TaxID=2593676 RepID=UPI0034015A13
MHRALFHRGLKPRIVALSARLAQIGLVLLMLSLNGAVFLLMDVVLGRTAAISITAVTTAIFAGLWFLLPWTARRA